MSNVYGFTRRLDISYDEEEDDDDDIFMNYNEMTLPFSKQDPMLVLNNSKDVVINTHKSITRVISNFLIQN